MLHAEACQDSQFQVIQTRISRGKKWLKLIIEMHRETLNVVLKVTSTIALPSFVLGYLCQKVCCSGSVNFGWCYSIFHWVNKNISGCIFVNFYEFWVKNYKITLFRNSACFFLHQSIQTRLENWGPDREESAQDFWNSIIYHWNICQNPVRSRIDNITFRGMPLAKFGNFKPW